VARAKRTDRAEARRRHRTTTVEGDLEGGEIAAEDEPTTPGARRTAGGSRPATGPRPASFMDALRSSVHRPDVRADIAALPALARTRAFYVPILLVVAGFLLYRALPENAVAISYFRLVVLPPAMAPVFIAGFFSKRASYLLGLIIATLDVVLYGVLVFGSGSSMPGGPLTTQQQTDNVISALVIGPISGLLFAAVAAWYRRFLNMTSRQRRPAPKQGTRSKSGRPTR
jgi:hypothetical protein